MEHQRTTATRTTRSIHATPARVTMDEDLSSYHGTSTTDQPEKALDLTD